MKELRKQCQKFFVASKTVDVFYTRGLFACRYHDGYTFLEVFL